MSWRKVQLVGLWLCIFLPLGASTVPQAVNEPQAANEKDAVRTMMVPGAGGQPGYTLRISVSGREGRVEVRNHLGAMTQTLTCPLLQDEANPSDLEVKGAAKEFVSRFEMKDLDLDGYLDLRGVREYGAKWARYCVWLFHPKTPMFSRSDPLAQQMESLYNLAVDPKRSLIISYSIGPVNPLVDEYRIERVGKDRPYWPRLVPVQSCFLENDSPHAGETDPGDWIVVRVRYDHEHPVVVRRPQRSGLCSEDLGKGW